MVDCLDATAPAGEELGVAEELDAAAVRLQRAVEQACADAPWPERVAAGLRAMVVTCASYPAAASLLGQLPRRIGPLAASRQSVLFAALSSALGGPDAPAGLVSPALLAGLGEVLLAALAEPGPDLERLAGDLTAIALRPRLGRAPALR